MATNPFIPADTRRRIARARTSTPSGGYRFAGAKAEPAAQAKQSGAAMRERFKTEQSTGEVVRQPARPMGKMFSTRNYATNDRD